MNCKCCKNKAKFKFQWPGESEILLCDQCKEERCRNAIVHMLRIEEIEVSLASKT